MATTSWRSKLRRWLRGGVAAQDGDPHPPTVKCFRTDQAREAAYDARDRGRRTVPLARIVGSVGRYDDFDERFRYKRGVPSERMQRVREAMRRGTPLPPVRLYQIKDDYYVLDGNHRVAAARELGHDDILANIVELIPSADTLENVIYRQRAAFADRTGLTADIRLSEVGQYDHLLAQICRHRDHLAAAAGAAVDLPEAAEDWYRTIYRPLCGIVTRNRLLDRFPGRTPADLYVYISHHQWEEGRSRNYGLEIDRLIPKDMEAFRTMMADRGREQDYPEMKRSITAFILMNVQGKHELKILDKLFALDEVAEVHAVHGDIDLLVKVNLSRDLLASDAEIISQFVTDRIRLIQGVNSTKTLIPGVSRVKKGAGGDPAP